MSLPVCRNHVDDEGGSQVRVRIEDSHRSSSLPVAHRVQGSSEVEGQSQNKAQAGFCTRKPTTSFTISNRVPTSPASGKTATTPAPRPPRTPTTTPVHRKQREAHTYPAAAALLHCRRSRRQQQVPLVCARRWYGSGGSRSTYRLCLFAAPPSLPCPPWTTREGRGGSYCGLRSK